MRGLLSILVLTSCLAMPAPARAADTRIGGFVHRKVELVRTEVRQLKAMLKDPAQRRQLIGRLTVTTAMIGVGEAMDIGLRQLGMPPLGAGFLAAALPTYAQYYAQLGMAKLSGRWFSPPQAQTQTQQITHAVFAGIVGVGAVASLQKISGVIDHDLPSQNAAAFGRLGASAGIGAASAALNNIRIGARKLRDTVVRATTVEPLRTAAPALLVPVAAVAQ